MTIDEAIKIIEMDAGVHKRLGHFEVVNAFKLGIEALKVIKELREGSIDIEGLELPGETEEAK